VTVSTTDKKSLPEKPREAAPPGAPGAAGARWGVALFMVGLAAALTLVLSSLPPQTGAITEGVAQGVAQVRAPGLLDRLAAALVSLMAAGALGLYAFLFLPRGFTTFRRMLLLGLVVVAWLTVAKLFLALTLPDHNQRYLAFMLPMAAAPMLIAALLDIGLGLVATVVLGLLTALVGFGRLDPGLSLQLPRDVLQMVTVFVLGGLAGVFVVKRAERANRYLMAGASVATVTLLTLLSFWLMSSDRQAMDLVWMVAASGLGGVLSAVVGMGGGSIVGPVFGITTRIQLMALAQLNHPLLRRLQQEAPGTFHHSAIVGNLAERAADLIDADALLVRAGCYFHDIGKLVKPSYYIENQTNGESPYDTLTPQASASLVIEHVSAGVELARRHGVPERVRAFIPEHHGTRLVTYFFRKAFGEDPATDPEPFRYLGPKPQSRETAIVMLADSVEAVVRSSHDRSPARIETLVQAVIAERASEGQLEQCELTLRDLKTIRDSFIATLRGVYHARIEYPAPSPGEESVIAATMAAPPHLPRPMDGTAPPEEATQ
jgi:putative nucleotidyltransferase with HDIG domain